jgi:lipoate-protein ligase A
MRQWRLLDTGPRSAADNVALDEVLLEERGRGASPNTVRFLQFDPPAVLLGYHQCAAQEVRTEYCRTKGIDINRRITGGGTIFFDRTQIGWEIICAKEFFKIGIANPEFFKKLCQPVIRALKSMGVNASFRSRNDIEVRGRKISGTGGTEDRNAFLFQGTLLVDFDVDTMMRALRIPIEKLKARELESAKERVTCLKWETGVDLGQSEIKRRLREGFEREFGVSLKTGSLTRSEQGLYLKLRRRFSERKWIDKVKMPAAEQPVITAAHRCRGGLIKTTMIVNLRFKRIQSLMITGDFFAYPQQSILDLESCFKDIPMDRTLIDRELEAFFNGNGTMLPGIRAADMRHGIFKALDRLKLVQRGISLRWANHVFPVNGSFEGIARARPDHILVPYCAKANDCGYRFRKRCAVCGRCSVSDVYGLAHKHRMAVVTILSFEDLMRTLERLRAKGVRAYIGCCCEAFYLKHLDDFRKAQLPGILVDINNTTCYDLGKARDSYRGVFENETDINVPLLSEVLDAM